MPSIDRPPPEPTISRIIVDDDGRNDGGRAVWTERLADVAETIARAPAGQQLAIGGLSGWCLGYTFMKVGKVVAITVGGGLVLLHIASYNGYVEVNWPKANSQVRRWRNRLAREIGIVRDPSTAEKVFQFAKDHVYLAGGLAAGFFLGLGSA